MSDFELNSQALQSVKEGLKNAPSLGDATQVEQSMSKQERQTMLSVNPLIKPNVKVNLDATPTGITSTILPMTVNDSSSSADFFLITNTSPIAFRGVFLDMTFRINAPTDSYLTHWGLNYPMDKMCLPSILTKGPLWPLDFFSQIVLYINNTETWSITQGLKPVGYVSEIVNPNAEIGVPAIRRSLESFTNFMSDSQNIQLLGMNDTCEGTTFSIRFKLPYALFDAKQCIQPGTPIRLNFFKNPAYVTSPYKILASGGVSGNSEAYGVVPQTTHDLKVFHLSLIGTNCFLHTPGFDTDYLREIERPIVVGSKVFTEPIYLPRLVKTINVDDSQWRLNHMSSQYMTTLLNIELWPNGTAQNFFYIIPEVTWLWRFMAADLSGYDYNQTWETTEFVPGLVALKSVELNNQTFNKEEDIMSVHQMSGFTQANSSWNSFATLLEKRGQQLGRYYSTKRLDRDIFQRGFTAALQSRNVMAVSDTGRLTVIKKYGQTEGPPKIAARERRFRTPWEFMKNAPLCVVPTLIDGDNTMTFVPFEGQVKANIRLMGNITRWGDDWDSTTDGGYKTFFNYPRIPSALDACYDYDKYNPYLTAEATSLKLHIVSQPLMNVFYARDGVSTQVSDVLNHLATQQHY